MTGLTDGRPIYEVLRHDLKWSDDEIQGFWYDWFCKDTSLANKGRKLLAKLRSITPSPLIDEKATFTFFKNNCPLHGRLYDDFRICDLKSGEVLYCVVPAEGYDRTYGEACVWGHHPLHGKFEELVRGNWKDVRTFFLTKVDAIRLELIDSTKRLNTIREAEYLNQHFDREARLRELDRKDEDREYASCLEALLQW